MREQRNSIAYLLVGLVVVASGVGMALGLSMRPDPVPDALLKAARATLAADSYTATTNVQTFETQYPSDQAFSSDGILSSDTSATSGVGTSDSDTSSNVDLLFRHRLVYQAPDRVRSIDLLAAQSSGSQASSTQVAVGSTLYRATTLHGVAGTTRYNIITFGRHSVPGAASHLLAPVTKYLDAVLSASHVQQSGSRYVFAADPSLFVQPRLPGYSYQNARAQVAVVLHGGFVRSITVHVLAPPASQNQSVVFTAVNSSPSVGVPPSSSTELTSS